MSDFDTLIRAGERRPRVTGEITFATGETATLTAADVIGFTVHEGVSDGWLLGAAISANCAVTLNGEGGAWLYGGRMRGQNPLPGARVRLSLGLEGTDETRDLCAFYVSDVSLTENDARVTLTGADALASAFGEAYRDDQTYPRTLRQIASHIAAQAGFDFDADFVNADVSVPEAPAWGDVSLRGALGFVACAAASFARISRAGALEFVPVYDTAAPFLLPAANTLSRVYGETAFGALAALVVTQRGKYAEQNERTYAAEGVIATNGNAMRAHGNPLLPPDAAHTATLASGMLAALGGMTLTRAQVAWQGDPALTIGRRVKITDHEGGETLTTVTRQSLAFDNGFSMTSECTLRSAFDTGAIVSRQGDINASRLTGEIDGSLVRAGTLAADSLIAGSVTATRLAAGSIGAAQIQANAVTADKIAGGAVTAGKIAANAITAGSAALADAAVSTAKIADAAITRVKIGEAAVGEAQIDDAAITSAKIADAAITRAKIGGAAIGTAQIETGAITTALIGTGAVETAQIADGSITDAKIVSLTANKLTAGTIDAGVIAVNNLTADNITTGTLNGQRIPVLGTDKLADGAVTADKVADGAITADKLVAGAVTAGKIAAQAVTANELAAGAVTAGKMNVADLFASEAFTGALHTDIIESGVGSSLDISGNTAVRLRVTSEEARGMIGRGALDGAGFRLEIAFSDGAVVTETGKQTTCAAKVYKNDADVTDAFGAGCFAWTRDTGDAESDAAWNALHTGVKSITLSMQDATGTAVIACTLTADENALPTGIAFDDGNLEAGIPSGDTVYGDLSIDADGNLIADGAVYAIDEHGNLLYASPLSLTAKADLTAGFKTSYITLHDDKMEIKSGGDMTIEAGGDFNLKGGDTAGEYLGISSTGDTTLFTGADDAAGTNAKCSVSKQGEVKMRDAQVEGEVEVNGEMTFGEGVATTFRDDAARHNFLRAMADADALPYDMGGTGADSRAGAMGNLGMIVGTDEPGNVTAQNVGDRYLLVKPGTTTAGNTVTPTRSGYYVRKVSQQRRLKTVKTYELLDGIPIYMPSDSTTYSSWADTNTAYGDVEDADAAYCHEANGTASNQYNGSVATTTGTGTHGDPSHGSTYAYWRVTTTTRYEYRTYTRLVYRAVLTAPTAGTTDADIKSSAVKTALLTLTSDAAASGKYSLSLADSADGQTNKTLIGTATGTGTVSFNLLDCVADLYGGAKYLVVERAGSSAAITVTAAAFALTYYSGARRTEEYIWNGNAWRPLALGSEYFFDESNDATVAADDYLFTVPITDGGEGARYEFEFLGKAHVNDATRFILCLNSDNTYANYRSRVIYGSNTYADRARIGDTSAIATPTFASGVISVLGGYVVVTGQGMWASYNTAFSVVYGDGETDLTAINIRVEGSAAGVGCRIKVKRK